MSIVLNPLAHLQRWLDKGWAETQTEQPDTVLLLPEEDQPAFADTAQRVDLP